MVYPVDKMMTVAILAGGKGKRFIPHKSFLELEGRTIIQRQLDVLTKVFNDILVITNYGNLYEGFRVEAIADIIPDKGALGGLYTALKKTVDKYCFVVASDMPYLNLDLIKYMMNNMKDYDAVVGEFNDKLEPLYAVYSKKCIPAIEIQIKGDNLKISDIFNKINTKIIKHQEISRFDPDGLTFTNINTQADYAQLTKRT